MEKQLTDNFRLSEFACKCGCGADHIDLRLVAMVQTIRTLFGKPIHITSGVRCKEHNASPAVGGLEDSAHLKGKAVDISCTNSTNRHRLIQILMYGSEDINRIGIADSFLHIDIDDTKSPNVVWTYKILQKDRN